VGGGPLIPEILNRFVELAGGPGHARIVYFPMASGDADAGVELTEKFRKMGAEAERIVLDHAQADMPENAARLNCSKPCACPILPGARRNIRIN